MTRHPISSSRTTRVPRIVAGETVGVVATGFAVERNAVERGVLQIEAMGFRTRLGRSLFKRQGYFAGSDAARAEDLNSMIQDPEVRAIWFARGGYGTARILDQVSWPVLAKDPKLLIGYSDLTAFFAAATQRARVNAVYGPVVAELGRGNSHHAESLRCAISGEPFTLGFTARDVVASGKATGRVIGGNLCVLAHLCGTPYAPDADKAILFLEEVGEQTYRIDRALNQLRHSGLFSGLAGVILGHFAVPAREHFPPDRRVTQVLREYFEPLGIPVVRRLPLGHRDGKRPIPLGEIATIDTTTGRIDFPRRFVRARVTR